MVVVVVVVILCDILLDQLGDVGLVRQDVATNFGREQQPDEGGDPAA